MMSNIRRSVSRWWKRPREGRSAGALESLAHVERVLNHRHVRDRAERQRLYSDLTMLKQQLAIARRVDAEGHGDQ